MADAACEESRRNPPGHPGASRVSLLLRAQSANQESSKALPDVYNGLRTQMLQSSRSKLNLPQASTPKTPWGVVMDWGVTKGTATVVALSDGMPVST